MAYVYCQEPGCYGDGMISSIYQNFESKSFWVSSRCCPKCNHHDEDRFRARAGEKLAIFGVTENDLRQDGYSSVGEKLQADAHPTKRVTLL